MQKIEVIDVGCQVFGLGYKSERDSIVDAIDVLMAYGLEKVDIGKDKAVFILSKDRASDETADIHFIYEARQGKKA